MAFKINMNHWEILVQFMEDHKDFARGKFVGPTGKENHKKLWTILTTKLNSLGMGERSIEKWQRTWCDLKYLIKKKAAQLKTDQQATGGGSPSTKPLTEYESRILSILGSTFAQGVGTEEYGVGGTIIIMMWKKVLKVGCTRAAELKDVEKPLLIEINTEKNSHVKEIAEPSVGATTSISANIIDHDHLYEPVTPKKKKLNKKRKRKYSINR